MVRPLRSAISLDDADARNLSYGLRAALETDRYVARPRVFTALLCWQFRILRASARDERQRVEALALRQDCLFVRERRVSPPRQAVASCDLIPLLSKQVRSAVAGARALWRRCA